MVDVQMYINNLYTNQSDYFSMPVSEEELAEKVGLNSDGHGYGASIEEISFVAEDISVEGIIQASKQFVELFGKYPVEDIWLLKSAWFHDYAYLYYNTFEIECYFGYDDFEAFGHYLIDEIHKEGFVSERLKKCIDYKKYAMLVELSNNYIIGKKGIYRYTG